MGGILYKMAKANSKKQKVEIKEEVPVAVKDELDGDKLDPQEEKILDWILKGVVAFILGWLGLSILMVIGGYFHLWG